MFLTGANERPAFDIYNELVIDGNMDASMRRVNGIFWMIALALQLVGLVKLAFQIILMAIPAMIASCDGYAQPTALDKKTRWQGYVRNFRDDHHFSLSTGLSKSTWQVRPAGHVAGFQTVSLGYYAKLRYAFHIQIWRSMGYFLGSSVGGIVERTPTAGDSFQPASSVHLPGFLAGLVFDLTPALRFGIGVDTYLERLDGVRYSDEYYSTSLSVNMISMVDGMFFMDVFHQLSWAVRAEFHARQVAYWRPESRSAGKVIDAQISRIDHWVGLGLVYHLL